MLDYFGDEGVFRLLVTYKDVYMTFLDTEWRDKDNVNETIFVDIEYGHCDNGMIKVWWYIEDLSASGYCEEPYKSPLGKLIDNNQIDEEEDYDNDPDYVVDSDSESDCDTISCHSSDTMELD
tara:strand:- start:1031 stop:1396 length:366 start_codon:yes stop_codon:yes gene_type:complete